MHLTYLCAFLTECAIPPVFMSTACNDLSFDAVNRTTKLMSCVSYK